MPGTYPPRRGGSFHNNPPRRGKGQMPTRDFPAPRGPLSQKPSAPRRVPGLTVLGFKTLFFFLFITHTTIHEKHKHTHTKFIIFEGF